MSSSALEARFLEWAVNPPELIEEHKRVTGGKVRTRFPPEPNGYLHIGHAKSLNMNFEGAFEKLGVPAEDRYVIFRYDDTNPEAESQEYIDAIAENVRWLGWKPSDTTFSSDHFPKLYDLAVKLIQKGKAYVCHQSKDEMKACRKILQDRVAAVKAGKDPLVAVPGNPLSPWRDRSVEENLRLFRLMKAGFFDEGKATLRMKMDMTSDNPNMWDTVAYRIKYVPHPHAGEKWCIYPTYDYTHCIIDALEHIDYSICTLEFETRRESYYWLLKELDLYRPNVYEFARLNLTYIVMSKRKILKLVRDKLVRGWDDPRLSTLNGLRRRGYTPQILNSFCKDIGVTRVRSTIHIDKLESSARAILGESAPRVMAVLEPLKVSITNLSQDKVIEVPLFPQDPNSPKHKATLTKVIYMDRKDFRLEDDPDFFGLAPKKEVMFKYAGNFVCTDVKRDREGNPVEIIGTIDFNSQSKPKGVLQWVGSLSNGEKPSPVEVRLYEHLFTCEDLDEHDDWENYLNPESEKVYPNALLDMSVLRLGTHFQFERLGYFVIDNKDSTPERPVFNRVVKLKESRPEEKDKKKDAALASRKEEQLKHLAELEAKKNLDPKLMFVHETDKYSAFDQDGVPTHDAEKQPLSKNAIKKLKAAWEKQKKIFEKK